MLLFIFLFLLSFSLFIVEYLLLIKTLQLHLSFLSNLELCQWILRNDQIAFIICRACFKSIQLFRPFLLGDFPKLLYVSVNIHYQALLQLTSYVIEIVGAKKLLEFLCIHVILVRCSELLLYQRPSHYKLLFIHDLSSCFGSPLLLARST